MVEITARARIAHLLRRAGFGATAAEVDEYLALGYEGAVERLLNPQTTPYPELDARLAALDLDPATNQTAFADLQIEWFNRMINTRSPLQEKMALFWHGHFATAQSKVNSPALMRKQYQLFLNLGLGNFQDLALGISRDPAMLLWLDGNQNRVKAPNENYGREFLELFSLGIGNYTEDDVKASARAFTGWFFQGERSTGAGKQYISGEFAFDPKQHDAGQKTFLGQTGNWDGGDIIRIVLAQSACARFIAGKLFSFFVWDAPEAATVAQFADLLIARNYDVRELLRAILLSPEFSSERAYRAKIKGPAEYVAGLMRALGLTTPTRDTVQVARRMGQEVFNPPNVGGWTSGLGWISPGSILERANYANKLVTARQTNANVSIFDPSLLMTGKTLTTPEALADHFIGLMLDGIATADQRATLVNYLKLNDQGQSVPFTLNAKALDSKVRGLIHLIAASPTYLQS
ncbi:MAG TPA: DUF1800 domain-containing protein [Thermomicrobiales bacterium]|jgi:uncharacterized protein (DUF1800 family)